MHFYFQTDYKLVRRIYQNTKVKITRKKIKIKQMSRKGGISDDYSVSINLVKIKKDDKKIILLWLHENS